MPSFVIHLLAPFALIVPAPPLADDLSSDRAAETAGERIAGQEWQAVGLPETRLPLSDEAGAGRRFLLQTVEPEPVDQVRIDQRLIIRIAPQSRGGPISGPPQVWEKRQFREKKTSRCLPVKGIAGVRVEDSRLILFMRDRRIIGANLEKTCRARDFYSGFYVDHTSDGMFCAGRDDVHSRAGATCAVSRVRQLVPDD